MDPLEARVSELERIVAALPTALTDRVDGLEDQVKRGIRIAGPAHIFDLEGTNQGGYNDLQTRGPELLDLPPGFWIFFYNAMITTSAQASAASVGQFSLAVNDLALAPDEAQGGMLLTGATGIMQVTSTRFAPKVLTDEKTDVRIMYGSINGALVRFSHRTLFGIKIL